GSLNRIGAACLPHNGEQLAKLKYISVTPIEDQSAFDQEVKAAITGAEDKGKEGPLHRYSRLENGGWKTTILVSAPGELTWPLIATHCEEPHPDLSLSCGEFDQMYSAHVMAHYVVNDPLRVADIKNIDEDVGQLIRSLKPDTSELEGELKGQ